MCTLLLVHRLHAFTPGGPSESTSPLTLLAANRDENTARPAEGWAPRLYGERRAFAPRDVTLGGTWMGMNDAGMVAAVTNRFGLPRDPSRRSRGEIVPGLLAHATRPSGRRVARRRHALAGGRHGPPHDRQRAKLRRDEVPRRGRGAA